MLTDADRVLARFSEIGVEVVQGAEAVDRGRLVAVNSIQVRFLKYQLASTRAFRLDKMLTSVLCVGAPFGLRIFPAGERLLLRFPPCAPSLIISK